MRLHRETAGWGLDATRGGGAWLGGRAWLAGLGRAWPGTTGFRRRHDANPPGRVGLACEGARPGEPCLTALRPREIKLEGIPTVGPCGAVCRATVSRRAGLYLVSTRAQA